MTVEIPPIECQYPFLLYCRIWPISGQSISGLPSTSKLTGDLSEPESILFAKNMRRSLKTIEAEFPERFLLTG
jgi:hypothetical protein